MRLHEVAFYQLWREFYMLFADKILGRAIKLQLVK